MSHIVLGEMLWLLYVSALEFGSSDPGSRPDRSCYVVFRYSGARLFFLMGGAEILLVSSSPARWATRLNRGLYPYYRSCHVFFSDMQKIRGGLLKTNFGDDMGEGGLVRGTVAFIELIFGN